jgi:hypothetical protein
MFKDMFKVPHDGEECSTMTKKPHRFEIYETWSGNTFKRRFVSTVTCYADPARDPKARADGNIPQPGDARTFPLPRTNERYNMIIKEVPGVSSHIFSLLTWRRVAWEGRSFNCISKGISRGRKRKRTSTISASDSGAVCVLVIQQKAVIFLTRATNLERSFYQRIILQKKDLLIVSTIRMP